MRIRVVLSAFVLVAATQSVGQVAAQVRIVVPSEYENTEAPGGAAAFATGFPNGYRLQSVVDSSAFAALPTSHQTMTGMFWRPDGFLGEANSVTWPNFTLRLSTTTAGPESLRMEFDANVGSDETVVYDGPITFTTDNKGPYRGPKEFDIAFEFEQPFQYDPSDGNLLIDWTVVGPAGWVGDDRVEFSSLTKSVSGERDARFATSSSRVTAVASYIFVPEPSSGSLLGLGIMGFIQARRRIVRRK